jgi:hypothetical protein
LPDKDAPDVPSEFIEEFHEPPPWLKEEAARARPVLPWLPLDCRNVMPSRVRNIADGLDGVRLESLELEQDEFPAIQVVRRPPYPPAPPLGDSVVHRAQALQKEIELAFGITSTLLTTNKISQLYVPPQHYLFECTIWKSCSIHLKEANLIALLVVLFFIHRVIEGPFNH